MKKKMTRTARMLSKGGTAGGGPKPKPKGGMRGGGGTNDKLKMVKDPKTGKQVPFFTVDGEGKMKGGGSVPPPKGYFKGGKTLTQQASESGVMPRGQTTQRALDSGAMNPSGGEVMPGRSQGGYRPPKPKRPRRGGGPRR